LFDPVTDELVWDSGEMFFVMDLWETANPDPCPDGNPNGTYPNVNGCADRLRVGLLDDYNDNGVIDEGDLPLADVGAGFEQPVASFAYGGDRYTVSLSGFWEVGPVLKGEAWTPENELTHLEVRAQVQIAEPSTLALMGLGVIGMAAGATRRREKKA
jgi:hypothetical protein